MERGAPEPEWISYLVSLMGEKTASSIPKDINSSFPFPTGVGGRDLDGVEEEVTVAVELRIAPSDSELGIGVGVGVGVGLEEDENSGAGEVELTTT